LIKSQEFTWGAFSYSISVYRGAEGFLAFCDCHTCPYFSVRTLDTCDQDAAIKECEELVRQHHDECHLERAVGVAGSCARWNAD